MKVSRKIRKRERNTVKALRGCLNERRINAISRKRL